MFKKLLPLLLIVIFGLLLRVYKIDNVPPSLNWDEVSHGWNAYSILKTGKDEWGQTFPIANFRAYGDYPLPLNLYLTIPFIWALGLNTFSVRLPHVLLGTLTIISSYFLFWGITRRKDVSLLGAFFVAIEPWLFFPSRFVLQSNLSVFFLTTAVALFVYRRFLLSFLAFGLTLFSYHTTRIFTPLFLVGIAVIYRHELAEFLKHSRIRASIAILILSIFLIPIPFILANSDARARAAWVFLVDQGAVNRIITQRGESKLPAELARFIYNRPVYFVREAATRYFDYFSPQFLFLRGGTQYQFSIPGWGLLYAANLPFFYIGLALIVWKAIKKEKPYQMVLMWLILAPIPASITSEKFAVLRATPMLPVPQLLTALGLLWALNMVTQKWRKIALAVYFLLLFGFAEKYFFNYFVLYKNDYSWSWQYGYKPMVDYIKAHYGDYDRFIITKKYGEPHEFLLFHWPWDPAAYQKDPNLVRFKQSDWYWVDRFDKFYFVNDWDIPVVGDKWRVESGETFSCAKTTRCLFVTSPGNYPSGWTKLKTIFFLDGKPAFEVLSNHETEN